MVGKPEDFDEADQRQMRYKKKVSRIRKIMKSMVFENAALCDQVYHMQETILCVKEERKFLLRKLIEYDPDIHIDAKPTIFEQQATGNGTHISASAADHLHSETASATAPQTPSSAVRTRKPYKKRNAIPATPTTPTTTAGKGSNKKPKKSHKKQQQQMKKSEKMQQQQQQHQEEQEQQQQEQQQHQQQEQQLQLSDSLAADQQLPDEDVQTIAVDEHGRPIYPIQMGANLAVFDLGEIVTNRPNYHNEHWLYPVGYVATRIYGHMREPQRKCVYTCKITDGGDYPLFEIIPETDMNYAIAGPSPDLCHAALLQTMNSHSNGRHVEVRPKGDWFFGLGHPAVVTLLLQQPQAELCQDFAGFRPDALAAEFFADATVNYEALQRYMGMSVYHHAVPEVKEEPPDQLLEQV